MKNSIIKNIHTTDRVLKKGEAVRWVSVVDKGWRTPKRITVTLAGADARFEWFIAVLGRGEESFPLDIEVVHAAPRTKAIITARCLLFDYARISFTGTARIEKRARAADTYLGFHTLLLSDHAYARTIPSLEIKTADVRASHAASVDRVSDTALFYCATRGLDEKSGRVLLSRAFLSHESPVPAPAAFTKLLESL